MFKKIIFNSIFKTIQFQQIEKYNIINTIRQNILINTINDDKGKGFGNSYDWICNLTDAIRLAKDTEKPIMFVVHKTWCLACIRLGKQFSDNIDILNLSKKFVMVNLIEDHDGDDTQNQIDKQTILKRLTLDGGYVPRIIFATSTGQILKEIINPRNDLNLYQYYYTDPMDILESMKNVLKLINK